jgi:hypothetical protein
MNVKKRRGSGTVNPSPSCCVLIPDYRAAIPVEFRPSRWSSDLFGAVLLAGYILHVVYARI